MGSTAAPLEHGPLSQRPTHLPGAACIASSCDVPGSGLDDPAACPTPLASSQSCCIQHPQNKTHAAPAPTGLSPVTPTSAISATCPGPESALTPACPHPNGTPLQALRRVHGLYLLRTLTFGFRPVPARTAVTPLQVSFPTFCPERESQGTWLAVCGLNTPCKARPAGGCFAPSDRPAAPAPRPLCSSGRCFITISCTTAFACALPLAQDGLSARDRKSVV